MQAIKHTYILWTGVLSWLNSIFLFKFGPFVFFFMSGYKVFIGRCFGVKTVNTGFMYCEQSLLKQSSVNYG